MIQPELPVTALNRKLFLRTERRYRVDEPAITALLDERLGAPARYRVTTDYYLRRSKKGEHRIRVRKYGDDPTAWVECKRRSDAFVTKRRSKGRPALGAWDRLGGVGYLREAWERGDLRVTLDRRIATDDGRTLQGLVLEVKGPRVPRWLSKALPRRARRFSKRRWMLNEPGAQSAPIDLAIGA